MNKLMTFFILFFITKSIFSETPWHLNNKGQNYYIQDSDFSNRMVSGISGIDANLIDTSSFYSPYKELIVAVTDSGLSYDREEFKGRIWDGINNKNYLTNFLDKNSNIVDDVGHGTHVAGLISSNLSIIGTKGVADSRIKLMPLKIVNNEIKEFVYSGENGAVALPDAFAESILFAINNGASVINASYGFVDAVLTPKLAEAFRLAEEKNVTIIAAAGNNNKLYPVYPCKFETVICVGAIDSRGIMADFSNFGAVDVAAPGEGIISLIPNSTGNIIASNKLRIPGFEEKKGTSQAAPIVSGIIANLKLFNPGITNDDIRYALAKSSIPLSPQDKFVKFGRVSETSLFDNIKHLDHPFVIPQIKEENSVFINADNLNGVYKLKLKNISNYEFNGKVCIYSKDRNANFENECEVVLHFAPHTTLTFDKKITIKSLKEESSSEFEIQIEEKVYRTPVVFIRNLNQENHFDEFLVKNALFEDMALIRSGVNLMKLTPVYDQSKIINYPEYYFLNPKKQNNKQTIISILTKRKDVYQVLDLPMPKVLAVRSVHRQDINLDGSIDYIVQADAKDNYFQIYIVNEDLIPVFGAKSLWEIDKNNFNEFFKLGNRFNLLNVFNRREQFHWIAIKNSSLGEIKVPLIKITADVAEEDNSKNILDRILGKQEKYFYLNPELYKGSVRLKLRTIESFSNLSKWKKMLNLTDTMQVKILNVLPQSETDAIKGQIQFVLKINTGYEFLYAFGRGNEVLWNIKNLATKFPLDPFQVYSVLNLENGMSPTDHYVWTTLISSRQAGFIEEENGHFNSGKDLKKAWFNPIISLLLAIDHEDGRAFITENEKTLSYFDFKGQFSYDIPINRESSMIGITLSEILFPARSESRPAIFSKSSTLFKNRIFSYVGTKEGLVRPIGLSVSIPDNCVPLDPFDFKELKSSSYVFLCGKGPDVSIKLLPMSF